MKQKRIIHLLQIFIYVVGVLTSIACSSDHDLVAPTPDTPSDTVATDTAGLHVDGRYLKDAKGNIVNLHGFCQIFEPYHNNYEWDNYDVDGCLAYGKKMVDGVLDAGWRMTYIRLQWSEYWIVPEGAEANYTNFDEQMFLKYKRLVYIPFMKYLISKGLYVVLCPPIGCPQNIAVGDDFQKFMVRVWELLVQDDYIRNNPHIMFELANEPQNILGTDGTYDCTNTGGHFENWKTYFQEAVDTIRQYADNVIWVPGLGYSSLFGGCTSDATRIEGKNIGYAVHCYPGWLGSGGENGDGGMSTDFSYESFQQGWDNSVGKVSAVAPIIVTEMDWAPTEYDSSWGKGYTGKAGGYGFGANFKYICDQSGNASWGIFTSTRLLRNFVDEAGEEGNYTFLNDPEACPWAVYHYFKQYAGESDPHISQTGGSSTSSSATIGGMKDSDEKAW